MCNGCRARIQHGRAGSSCGNGEEDEGPGEEPLMAASHDCTIGINLVAISQIPRACLGVVSIHIHGSRSSPCAHLWRR